MYLVVDTETGGIDPTSSSLLQLYCAVYDDNFKEVDHMELKLKPDNGTYLVTPGALKVNNIDLVSHDTVACTYTEGKGHLGHFINENAQGGRGKLTVVGWNVHFDLGFIFEHLLSKYTWEKYVSYRVLDLQPIGQYLKLTNKVPSTLGNLSSYASHFGADVEGAHDAKFDVGMTAFVFKKFLEIDKKEEATVSVVENG